MVITTPFVTKSILDLKPYNKLFPPTASTITIVVREKGVKESWSASFEDIEVMKQRITIGRVSNSSLQIDDWKVSRLHAIIECSPADGKWTFQDVQSLNGSIVNGTRLKPKTPHVLEKENKISIGRVRWKLCHMLEIFIHHLVDDVPDEVKPPRPRKVPWRRSLYCNACMGYGPRHSCTMRVSILRKLILDANRKSNVYAARIPKTLLQKAQMQRLSYWWPKAPGADDETKKKKDALEIPANYNDDPEMSVKELPDFDTDRPPPRVEETLFNSHLSI